MAKTKENAEDESYSPSDNDFVNANALEIITKAELENQVDIAKRYPRELKRVRTTVLELAAADKETAESCFFALPRTRKKEDGTKEKVTITGESIRLAEIVSTSWMNMSMGKRVLGIDKATGEIIVQAIVHDLESNNRMAIEERRNIRTKEGYWYNQDMINLTGRAASSVAHRNAVFAVIPKAFLATILKEIKQVAIGEKPGYLLSEEERADFEKKKKPLLQRVQDAVNTFKNMGVPEQKIFHSLGVKSVEEIDQEGLAVLIGIFSGLKQAEFNLMEAFEKTPDESAGDRAKGAADEVLKNRKTKDDKK